MNHSMMAKDGGASQHTMSMVMTFTADLTGYKMLFEFWPVNNYWQFVLTMLALFVVSALFEMMRVYKHNHFIKDCRSRKRFICGGASPSPIAEFSGPKCCQNSAETPREGGCCHPNEASVVLLKGDNSTKTEVRPTNSCSTMRHRCLLSHAHLIQTLLHVVLTTVSFLLMLAAMTFNLWAFLAIILGGGVGYFFSGYLLETPIDSNSCCV